MSYKMNLGEWNSVFAVPSSLVDTHMRLAGAVQLKTFLWALRHAGEDFTIQDLSAAVGASEADTRDAMRYWIETGLLCQTGSDEQKILEPAKADAAESVSEPTAEKKAILADKPSAKPKLSAEKGPVRLVSSVAGPGKNAAPKKANAVSSALQKRVPRRIQKPGGEFVADRINSSQEISFLMQEAQLILGRPISPGLSSALLSIHDDYGLPVDVIVMLLQYVKNLGKDNTNYIESVARGWAADGVFSHEAAERKLRQLDKVACAWKNVEKVVGISHRSPSLKEEQFARRWIMEWEFTDDMVREAYERCVNSTGKLSLSYMNRILERWQKDNIKTLKEAASEKSRTAMQKNSGRTPSYDIEEFEKMSDWEILGRE